MKALSDVICTSGNAVKIVNASPADRKLLFVPDENLGAWVMEKTGRRTVPQIYIGDQYVGGYDELAALDRAGELDKILGASKNS